MCQDRRGDQRAAADEGGRHVWLLMKQGQVLLLQRIDPIPSPKAGVSIYQPVRGVQNVVGGELFGQLVTALHQRETFFVVADGVNVSQPNPEEAKHPVTACDDAVDQRLFLSRVVQSTRVVNLGNGQPAQ